MTSNLIDALKIFYLFVHKNSADNGHIPPPKLREDNQWTFVIVIGLANITKDVKGSLHIDAIHVSANFNVGLLWMILGLSACNPLTL